MQEGFRLCYHYYILRGRGRGKEKNMGEVAFIFFPVSWRKRQKHLYRERKAIRL